MAPTWKLITETGLIASYLYDESAHMLHETAEHQMRCHITKAKLLRVDCMTVWALGRQRMN